MSDSFVSNRSVHMDTENCPGDTFVEGSLQDGDRSRNVLDDLHQVQVNRSNKLKKPFSSPLKCPIEHTPRSRTQHPKSSPLRSSHPSSPESPIRGHRGAHNPSNGHRGIVNSRNKYDQLSSMRLQYRQQKLQMQRNRTFDRQSGEDQKNDILQQADGLDVDIDTLIEEERDLEDDEYIRQYENELDEFELEQELEIAELMDQLDIQT